MSRDRGPVPSSTPGPTVPDGAVRRAPHGRHVPGPLLFARYAYPPNALGYCGPGDPAALLGMASEGAEPRRAEPPGDAVRRGMAVPAADRRVQRHRRSTRPPGRRGLLDRQRVGDAASHRRAHDVARRPLRAPRRAAARPVTSAAPGGVAQHNFHVFAVYPWLGLLRAGMDGPPLEVLDRCRIRWGRIEAVTGELVTVRSRRLRFDGSRLTLGAEQTEQARRSLDGVRSHRRPPARRHGVAALGLGVRPIVTRSPALAAALHGAQPSRRQRPRPAGPSGGMRSLKRSSRGLLARERHRTRRNRVRTGPDAAPVSAIATNARGGQGSGDRWPQG